MSSISIKSNNVKRNLLYQICYRLLLVLTPVITSPYISRVLGPENIGIFSASYAYVNYFMLFCLLGIETYGNRCIAKSEDLAKVSKNFWNIYYVQTLASILTIAIYFFTLVSFVGYRKDIALVQSVWLFACLFDINWLFFGLQRFDVTVLRNLFIKIITIISIFVFIRSNEDLTLYVLIMSIGNLLGQIVLWRIVFKEFEFEKPDLNTIKEHFKPILKLFFPVLAFSVFHILDKTIIDIFSDDLNSGCYYSVDRLINIPLNIVVGISTVMLPRITRMLSESRHNDVHHTLNSMSELIIIFSSAIAFGLSAVADVFVPVFFGDGYDLCIYLIWASAPLIIVKSLSDFVRQQYLIPFEKDYIYIKAVLYGAVINIGVNVVLVSKMGALGACYGTLIAEVVVLIYQIFNKDVKVGFMKMFRKHCVYFVYGAVMAIGLRCLCLYSYGSLFSKLICMILVGGVVYLAMVIFHTFKNTDTVVYKLLNNKEL